MNTDSQQHFNIIIIIHIIFTIGVTWFNQTLGMTYGRVVATYENNIAQISAAIRRSEHCRQLLQVECDGGYSGPKSERYWTSDNGTMYNWGTPTGTTGCTCGLIGGNVN